MPELLCLVCVSTVTESADLSSSFFFLGGGGWGSGGWRT